MSSTEHHVTLQCTRCGEDYTRHPSVAGGSSYCSNDCRYARQYYVPEEERVSYEDIEWGENRHKAELRDDFTCQICSGSAHDGTSVVVHHVVPIPLGGGHELHNLDTLCVSCHSSIHSSGDFLLGIDDGAALLPRESDLLGSDIPVDIPVSEVIEMFQNDVEFLAEHHPGLLDELHETVCDGEVQEE